MRLSNKRKAPLYSFLNTLFVVSVSIGIFVYLLGINLDIPIFKNVLFVIIPPIALFIFYLRGRQIFEYDSDGEALNFKNRHIITWVGKIASDEFPKYKLKSYDVVNAIFFKRLYITISSRKSSEIKLRYDISYLTEKEIKDLKFSLNKIVNRNRENANQ